jgi:hypothetical protein
VTYYRPAPVYYRAPPVLYRAPPVVYAPRPVYRVRPGAEPMPGWGHGRHVRGGLVVVQR